MDEFVHESIVMHSEPSSRAALVAQLNSIVDAVPDFHWETQELAVNGDSLAARLIKFLHMSAIHDAEALQKQLAA